MTSYGFDPVSRLTSLTHALAGTTGDLTKTFAYNPASQIASETRSNDAYAWNGAVNVNRPYVANNLNQYASVNGTTFAYDANGNLTSDGTNTFAYDAENKLTSATVWSTHQAMSYDPLGRLWRVNAAADLRYFYDGSNMAAQYDSNGNLQNRYVFGPGADEPLVQYNSSGVRAWYYADERGSILGDTDDTGAVIAINSYDEYGIPGTSYTTRFGYTGQLYTGTGLYYYKNRFYSNTLGRFLQTDPIGYGDGMNWYNYVHSDPVNGRDASGMQADKGCDGISNAICSGGAIGGPYAGASYNYSDGTTYYCQDGNCGSYQGFRGTAPNWVPAFFTTSDLQNQLNSGYHGDPGEAAAIAQTSQGLKNNAAAIVVVGHRLRQVTSFVNSDGDFQCSFIGGEDVVVRFTNNGVIDRADATLTSYPAYPNGNAIPQLINPGSAPFTQSQHSHIFYYVGSVNFTFAAQTSSSSGLYFHVLTGRDSAGEVNDVGTSLNVTVETDGGWGGCQ